MIKTYVIYVLLCNLDDEFTEANEADIVGSTIAMAKFISRFQLDLDDEEHRLLRSAYDTPSYDHDDYEEKDKDLEHGQTDLQKDIAWAIKAKLKELKAFNKALAANMLSTNLKLKDLLQNHMDAIKNHHHKPPTTPAHPHHRPSIQPAQYSQYAAQNPQYPAQNPQYPAQNPQYPAQNPLYPAQNLQYPAQITQYHAQNPQYPAQKPQYPAQYALQYPYYAQQHGQGLHDPYRGL